MTSGIERLRQFARNTVTFWRWITFATLFFAVVVTFVSHPAKLGQPAGWLILVLAALYAVWYAWGQLWVAGRDEEAFWRRRINNAETGTNWRGIAVWLGHLAITMALVALDGNFRWSLFAVYALSFAVMSMPRALVLTVPTAAIIFASYHWFPRNISADQLLSFAGNCITFVVFSAFAYFPYILLRSRFARERMYADLERSHRELEIAHQQLEEAHRQLAESTERDRELAVLRERGRLARDMHDTLGHSLALMAVKLDAAQRLRAVDAARAEHEVAATQAIARQSLAELRATIANLRAPVPNREPLGHALARVAREAGARAAWRVTCDVEPEIGPLGDATYEALLRVGGEALTNVERHARATAVTLRLAREGRDALLSVQDDGAGILATNPPDELDGDHVPAATRSPARSSALGNDTTLSFAAGVSSLPIRSPRGHYGIIGMRERVAAVHGTLRIGPSADGVGTLVEARVPVMEL